MKAKSLFSLIYVLVASPFAVIGVLAGIAYLIILMPAQAGFVGVLMHWRSWK